MSKTLCIANTTRQNHLFQVRWLGDHTGRPFSRLIPSGGQVQLTERDLGADAETKWEAIVAHLERYGARDAAELHREQIEDYKGLTYRWELPVDEEEILLGHQMVLDNADRTSAEEAVKAAQGFDVAINNDGPRRARVTAVEVVEDVDPRSGPREDRLQFGVTVDPEAQERPGRRLRRRA